MLNQMKDNLIKIIFKLNEKKFIFFSRKKTNTEALLEAEEKMLELGHSRESYILFDLICE